MTTKSGINQIDTLDQGKFLSVPKIDYLLVYLLLCFSGNNALSNLSYIDYLYAFFAISLAVILIQKKESLYNQKLILISAIFGVLLIIQGFSFKYFSYITIAGFYVRLYIGFAVLFLVKRFLQVYVQVIIFLAIVSLFFYCLQEVGYAFGSDVRFWFQPIGNIFTISSQRIPFFIHTYLSTGIDHRNSGMFWEPGAFAGYLIIALIFLAIIKDEIAKRNYKRSFLILSITLISTLSTTGFIAYPFVISAYSGTAFAIVLPTVFSIEVTNCLACEESE